jgi:hypothetical protein
MQSTSQPTTSEHNIISRSKINQLLQPYAVATTAEVKQSNARIATYWLPM